MYRLESSGLLTRDENTYDYSRITHKYRYLYFLPHRLVLRCSGWLISIQIREDLPVQASSNWIVWDINCKDLSNYKQHILEYMHV